MYNCYYFELFNLIAFYVTFQLICTFVERIEKIAFFNRRILHQKALFQLSLEKFPGIVR